MPSPSKGTCRGRRRSPLPVPSRVALVRRESRFAAVLEALEGIEDLVAPSLAGARRILVKPNLVNPSRPLACTHPEALRAVLEFLRRHSQAPIVVGEGSCRDTWEGYRSLGLMEAAAGFSEVEFLDFNTGPTVEGRVVGADGRYRPAPVARAAVECDYRISLAPVKTHDRLVATLSLKNYAVGILVGPERDGTHFRRESLHQEGYPAHHRSVARLAADHPPHLGVLDAFEAMEGEGPTRGDPVPLGVALASPDLVALDALGVRLMGIDPEVVAYLGRCRDLGLGEMEAEVTGNVRPEEVARPFRLHSTYPRQVAWLEERELDPFEGADALVDFSARLMAGEEVSEQQVAGVLGLGLVRAFRYAEERLNGRVRRTTREPALCHSVDIALRALDLGYPEPVLRLALLHDTVEDSSRTLEEVSENLAAVGAAFGPEVQADVRLITNRYDALLRQLEGGLPPGLPLRVEALPALYEALETLQGNLPERLRWEFDGEFRRLRDGCLESADFAAARRKANLDRSYTLLQELRLYAYGLYAQEVIDAARPRGGISHEFPLVVKLLDLVDNLRTSEVVTWFALERILVKAEAFLDRSFYLHEHFHRLEGRYTFLLLYDYVKYNLVQQLRERSRALEFLSDTRFGSLARHLQRKMEEVQEKYRVEKTPARELRRLREEIRRKNRA